MVHGYIYLLNELFNLIQVVKEVGKRMMEKAYMGEPARQSRSLSNEEHTIPYSVHNGVVLVAGVL